MKLNEEIFKKAAENYALKYGGQMLEKADKLNSEIKSVPVKNADKILSIERARSKKRAVKLAASLAAAACVAVAVIIPVSLNLNLKNDAAAAESAYDTADSVQAAPEAAPAHIPADSEEAAASSGDGSPQNALNYKGAFSSQIINIEKKLPKSYKFISAREDNGIAACELEDGFGDTVTLTLSSAEENAENYSVLNEYDLDGIYAYGAAYSDYSYLTYEKDGVVYTLTSKYGLDELFDLAADLEG